MGEPLTLTGLGDDDGNITRYVWTLEGEEIANTTITEITIPPLETGLGNHTLGLRVQDDHGIWSRESNRSLVLHERPVVWFEEIIRMVEMAASCEVYSVLKREDEKYVTEKAFENPKFVEDVAREVAGQLMDHDRIAWFSVSVENQESIHAHNAYAFIERDVPHKRKRRSRSSKS